MSVREDVGEARAGDTRKPGAVFVFVPILIAILGAAALYLAQVPEAASIGYSGYGIDEIATAGADRGFDR